MACIRILHASDLHISRRPNLASAFNDEVSSGTAFRHLFSSLFGPPAKRETIVSTHDKSRLLLFAQAVFNDYYRHMPGGRLGRQPIDLLLLTGDLATTGLLRDLKRVEEFLESMPPDPLLPTELSSGRPTIAAVRDGWDGHAGMPVWLLPGNHDRYRRSRVIPFDYSPGGRNFDHVLRDHWSNPSHGLKWGPHVFEYPPLTKGNLDVRIIAADFNLRRAAHRDGPLRCKYAQGRVYKEILKELVAATEDVKDDLRSNPAHVIFWAVHFPPHFPYKKNGQEMKLNDEDKLVAEADRLGVRAILSGHTHEQTEYTVSGTSVEVFCAGTATQFDARPKPRHDFRIIEVCDDAGRPNVSHEHYHFDRGRYVRK